MRVYIIALFTGLLLIDSSGFAQPQRPSDIVTPKGGGIPYSLSAYRAGRADALRDIRRGRLAVETYGLPADIHVSLAYRDLLRRKYGVHLVVVAGCEPDDATLGHARGYNEISCAEIQRRFGRDFLDRVYEEAERWQKRATNPKA
jgi:hypothetical protein